MLNTANEINTWLKSQIANLPDIFNDMFPTAEGVSLICRHDPSQAVERRFLDRTRYVVEQFTYYARSTNPAECRSLLDSILKTLDTQEVIRVSDSISVQCEAVTLPQFVQEDDKHQCIYSATIQVEYTETVADELDSIFY